MGQGAEFTAVAPGCGVTDDMSFTPGPQSTEPSALQIKQGLLNHFTDTCSGSEEGCYLRRIDFCITQL